MDAVDVARFFAIILLGGSAGLIAGAAYRPSRPVLGDSRLTLAGLIAVGATAGSLYFSEIAHYVPCELCWYQRIAMYPLAVVLVIAAIRGDRTIIPYAATMALGGLAVSAYHVQLQLFPGQGSFCEAVNPCSGRWVEAFGWMTIPQMAGTCFLLMLFVLLFPFSTQDQTHEPQQELVT